MRQRVTQQPLLARRVHRLLRLDGRTPYSPRIVTMSLTGWLSPFVPGRRTQRRRACLLRVELLEDRTLL
jgi:hypothetical protein